MDFVAGLDFINIFVKFYYKSFMAANKSKQLFKKVIPEFILDYVRKIKARRSVNHPFANFILSSAIQYSKEIDGDVSSFDRNLTHLIKNPTSNCNSIIQDILTAFMTDYKSNLYQYYKNQEYLIFYRFLSYPFIDSLSAQLLPYKKGLSYYNTYDILDYGSGIPYGLINALRENKPIRSVTLIDLDLAHVNFVKFLILKIAPKIELNIYKITDTNIFPKIDGKFNFFYGKDIFEHLKDPLENLKKLMECAMPETVCYFDFQHHGEIIYQHVSPDLPFLSEEMVKMGFRKGEFIEGLSEFFKEA